MDKVDNKEKFPSSTSFSPCYRRRYPLQERKHSLLQGREERQREKNLQMTTGALAGENLKKGHDKTVDSVVVSRGRRSNRNIRPFRSLMQHGPTKMLKWPAPPPNPAPLLSGNVEETKSRMSSEFEGVVDGKIVPKSNEDEIHEVIGVAKGRRGRVPSSSSLPSLRTERKASNKRRLFSCPYSRSKGEGAEGMLLWSDKHYPKRSADLCVAPKKVREIRSWMESALEDGCTPQRTSKVLVLVGSPGVGKSTTVQVLASELNLNVLQWNDSIHTEYTPSSYSAGGGLYGEVTGANGACIGNAAMAVPYQSQMDSFEEFLRQGGRFRSLDFVGCVAEDTTEVAMGALKSKIPRGRKKVWKGGCGGANAAVETNNPRCLRSSLLLIDELPNRHNGRAEERFRSTMAAHVRATSFPTVLVFSDVSEGKASSADLERLIYPEVLHNSGLVTITRVNSVTDKMMIKCLHAVARAEGINSDSSNFLMEVCAASAGDLRGALMAMQFRCAGGMVSVKRVRRGGVGSERSGEDGVAGGGVCVKRARRGGGGSERSGEGGVASGGVCGKRDLKLNSFHALGKILYAKRQTVNNESNGKPKLRGLLKSGRGHTRDMLTKTKLTGRPPLSFDPEEVLGNNEMGPNGALSFLSYHCPDFFTDEIELSQALHSFSDAAVFASRAYDTLRDRGDSVYPTRYLSNLAGWAVADANRHPAPGKFRSFGAPRLFDVFRKRGENEWTLTSLALSLFRFPRFDVGGNINGRRSILLDGVIGSANTLVTETLPCLRSIFPAEMDRALSSLHTISRTSEEITPVGYGNRYPLSRGEVLEEQRRVLEEDDIVEEDDDIKQSDKDALTGNLVTKHPEAASHRDVSGRTRNINSADHVEVIIIDSDEDYINGG